MRKICMLAVLVAFAFATAISVARESATAKGASGKNASGATAAVATAQPAAGQESGLYMTFETEKGTISCKLFEKEAPVTVDKIVGLATGRIGGKKFYDGLTFHRVIPNFMIQGGDPQGTGMGSPREPGFPFKDEFVPTLRFDVPGRLAMANSGPNTNGSQFFITDAPTPHLNNHHTIFGQCENLDVVKAIARVPARQDNNKPLTPVHMIHVLVKRVGPAPANAPESGPAGKPSARASTSAPAKKPS